MAKSKSTDTPAPPVRRWLGLFYALPVLGVLCIYGYLFYARSHHLRQSAPVLSTTPFITLNFSCVSASLFTSGDQLHPYGNDIAIEFHDSQGRPTNVGDVAFELSLSMSNMVMHSLGKVHSDPTPGRYHTTLQPQVGGDWTAQLSFTNASGSAQTNFPLTIK